LDGQYAAFGKVIEGMETVDDFLNTERVMHGGELSRPVTPIVMKKAEIIE
ncbi:MAG: peptidylprolyl isomerase, partial [Clostridia bacterium]|nr:peptidylprolyl isomerase [Clostridia bacterium]